MAHRIVNLEIRDGLAAPASAEVWVRAEVEQITPTTELRGRLMGPHCRFAATVEVAYPLRPFPRVPPGMEGASGRVVIPEASLWEPESPFLYGGSIELWSDGRLCERVPVSHGIRTLSLGSRGLIINGRRVTLRGRTATGLTEDEALALRATGINLLVVPVAAETALLWPLADRVGFLMLGQVQDADPCVVQSLAAHPSSLGWIAAPNDLERWLSLGRVGVSLEATPPGGYPDGAAFVIGPAALAPSDMPVILRGTGAAESPRVFGTID